MSDINSQIAERIKELQEQNEARAKEQEAAEKAVAEGSFESKPVVEQVKRKKKKKKSVSVKEKPAVEKEAAEEAIPTTGDMEKESVEESSPEERKDRKADRSRLDNAFSKMQTLTDIDMPPETRERDTKSVPKEELEKARDEEAEKPKSSKERGRHAKVSRVVRYVDQSGKALGNFCLIDTETGEIKEVKDGSIIGRAPDMDVVLNNRFISGRHARVFKDGADFYIEDLGSTNGTKVNDTRIDTATKIVPGDRIKFAAKEFVFEATK